MSIEDQVTQAGSARVPARRAGENAPTRGAVPSTLARVLLAVSRIALGLVFLWAFADKVFGLGYATSSAQAWIHGGSPTKGFLANVHVGPLAAVLRSWAGQAWVDWLFMIGMGGIGLALVLGVGLRIAAGAGTAVMLMMWLAEWPLAKVTETGQATGSSNPIIDDHIIYVLVLLVLAATYAGDTWGLGRPWAAAVRHNPWLR